MLTDQQLKLKTMRTSKVKDQQSIETKIFKVLKEIGVELSSYHGGSLNGKDIRKVMTNACYIFDTFVTIFKVGKRPNCMLSDANINALCMQFCEVFVLRDLGIFISKDNQSNRNRLFNLQDVCQSGGKRQ